MALALPTYDSELAAFRGRIADRLRTLRGRIRVRLCVEIAARIVVAIVALAICTFVLDWWLELGRVTRIVAMILAAGLVGAIAVRSVLAVARLRLDPIDLAAELDKVRGLPPAQWLAPRVATVVQLSDPAGREAGFSSAMVERAVRQSFEMLDRVDFSRQLDERHLRRCAIVLVSAVAVPLVFAATLPRELSSIWARRWLMGSTVGWPRDTSIEVLGLNDGRLVVPRGEPAAVRVLVHDRRAPTETVWIEISAPGQAVERSTMVKFGTGDFRYELRPLGQTAAAHFSAGDGRAGPIEIVPVDRPRIARLNLVYQHPRDKAPQTYQFTGEEANVRLLKETDATLTLAANVAVSELDVSADGAAAPKFERIDERTFRAKWLHEGALQMKVGMVGRDSQLASRPQPIAIGFREDRPPRITLTHSGVGARVTPNALIPLKVSVRDDFAVTRAALAFKIAANMSTSDKGEGERAKPADIPLLSLFNAKPGELEPTFDGGHDWDLQPLKLVPGDTVSTTAEATDDCYTGLQTSRSRTLLFRVVSEPELFREILQKQQQLRARLRRAEEQGQAVRESMRSASLPNDGDDLLRRHNLIQREVWQVMHGIEDSATEMRLNRLGGAETHEIIARTVIAPLERLHDDLLTRQRQALESLRQPAAETQEQLVGRQQEILDAMEKILKNMAQWDSFIDVVNQLNEVIKLEQAVREKTEDLKKKQFDSIFDSK